MEIPRYSFELPTKIEFGAGVINEAGAAAKAMGATKVMLVADKGVINAGLTKAVEDGLKQEHIPYIIFDDIVPNPRDFQCESGANLARAEKVDLLIAVGGGSSMDVAKAIGVLLTHSGRIQDYCGFQLLKQKITPLIAIPTTAGTGSEVTPFAVITDSQTHVKLNVFDPKAAASLALIDPGTLLNLPSHIMAACGIDAMTHAVEAFTCTVASPHTDANALYAIELIIANLRDAVHNPTIESCTGMMLGSTIAGIAFGYADVASVHCMAEALGGRYDIAHGVANAILLPTVTKFNIPAATEKYARAALAMGIDIKDISAHDAAMQGADELQKLCLDVDIPKMNQIPEIKPEDFPALAKASEANVSNPSNPRPMTEKEYLKLFKEAYAL